MSSWRERQMATATGEQREWLEITNYRGRRMDPGEYESFFHFNFERTDKTWMQDSRPLSEEQKTWVEAKFKLWKSGYDMSFEAREVDDQTGEPTKKARLMWAK